jgi:hypothetical protein
MVVKQRRNRRKIADKALNCTIVIVLSVSAFMWSVLIKGIKE